MDFEWDESKSRANKKKHGISFDEAVEIWEGPNLNIDEIAHSKDGEKRSATIGIVQGKVFTAIWTKRKASIRLISVRRSRDGEEEAFWQKII